MQESICNHIIKCIIYGDTTNSLNHWINQELSSWLSRISNMVVQTPKQKLSKQQYSKLLFDDFANDVYDMYVMIGFFKDKYIHKEDLKNPLPDFELDYNISKLVFEGFTQVKNAMSTLLASKSKYTKEEIAPILKYNLIDISSDIVFIN